MTAPRVTEPFADAFEAQRNGTPDAAKWPPLVVYDNQGRLQGDCPGCGMAGRVTPRGRDGLVRFDCDGKCGAGSGVYRRADADDIGQVAEIRRALLEDAQDPRDADGPAREQVPGTGELLHRGVAAVLFGERGQGKSTVALAVALGAAEASEKVLYLDRENGPQLIRERVHSALEALGRDAWPEGLVIRAYPQVSADWPPEATGEAIAGLGFTVVIFDSLREFLAELGLDPNSEQDVSSFFARFVTPLISRTLAVALLDNVGHEKTDRPKGSGTKLDAPPQAYKVFTTEQFSPALVGRINIRCTRSRYGDMDRDWTMRVGDGVFEFPAARSESPDARIARERREKRHQFHRAALAVLREQAPLGRDALVDATRRRGIRGRNATLRDWLGEIAADPASGILSTDDGYTLATPGPADQGHPGATPLEGPGPAGGYRDVVPTPAGHPGPDDPGHAETEGSG